MVNTRTMRIGEVARRLGMNASTIRRLEARGLIRPARDWAGHRRFSSADIVALRRLVGLPIPERAPGGLATRAPRVVRPVG